MDSLFRPKRQGGFTLVELTAVIAIVGTLSALALPRYAGMMRSARVARMNMARGAVGEVEMNGKGWPTSAGVRRQRPQLP